MDNSQLLAALGEVPESRPRILDLARELTGEGGRLEAELTRDQELQVEMAEREARIHAAATQRLERSIRSFMKFRQ